MWYRASHARRLWQTEHTAGGIQEGKNERGSRGGNHLKGWTLVVPNVRGILFRHFWIEGRYEGAPARKRPCRSRAARRFAQPMVGIQGVVHERELSIKQDKECAEPAVGSPARSATKRRSEWTCLQTQ